MANYFTYLKQSANHIPNATLTPTTEDSNFPVENCQTEPVAKIYRATDDAAEKILIDFASAVDADFFAIVNQNLTSAATITLEGGSSPDPSGQFQTTLSWAERNAWNQFASQTWQHWSITIDDGANPDLAIEIGMLMLGETAEISKNFRWRSRRRRETLNQSLQSELGVYTVGSNIYQRRRFLCEWEFDSAAERDEIDDFLTGLEREKNGLFLIPDPNETEAYYGRLITDHEVRQDDPNNGSIGAVEFLEDSFGRSIFAL